MNHLRIMADAVVIVLFKLQSTNIRGTLFQNIIEVLKKYAK